MSRVEPDERPDGAQTTTGRRVVVLRHRLAVRVMHWINVVALTVLLLSGLGIFNAFSQLHWARSSYGTRPPILNIEALEQEDGRLVGVTRLFGHEFVTTGVLGVSSGVDGEPAARAFPSWLTLPGGQWLAMSRSWHFFFAWVFVINGLCYLGYTLASGHLRRDLWPTRADRAVIGRSLVDHLLLRHAKGEAARRYNVLQKLSYLVVIFVLLPGIALLGLAMSPRMDALWPGWVDLLGGRDAARTLHFLFAWLIVAFVLVHLFEVLVSGPLNQLRSMITGRFAVNLQTPDETQR
jgi:thiosulfate reductase cytochrome b subunit